MADERDTEYEGDLTADMDYVDSEERRSSETLNRSSAYWQKRDPPSDAGYKDSEERKLSDNLNRSSTFPPTDASYDDLEEDPSESLERSSAYWQPKDSRTDADDEYPEEKTSAAFSRSSTNLQEDSPSDAGYEYPEENASTNFSRSSTNLRKEDSPIDNEEVEENDSTVNYRSSQDVQKRDSLADMDDEELEEKDSTINYRSSQDVQKEDSATNTADEELYEERTSRIFYRSSGNLAASKSGEIDLDDQDSDSKTFESRLSDVNIARKLGKSDRFGMDDSQDNFDKPVREHSDRSQEKTRDWSKDSISEKREGKHKRSKGHKTDSKQKSKDSKQKSKESTDSKQKSKESTDSKQKSNYFAVTKWEVDYDNVNYIRSLCNKPLGLHRHSLGKNYNWKVEYNNNLYIRSKVNTPKGYHRRELPKKKKKRVPDHDILADSTGWQFGYGPEFDQVEDDVPFMPDERRVSRGAYRCYGVKRNYSDSDRKIKDEFEEIQGIVEHELKYGAEFMQDDCQHVVDQKEGRIGKGAYRYHTTLRNIYDYIPCDKHGVDYRTSRITVDEVFEDDEEEEDVPKGKPFKRTILKKVVTLGTSNSRENIRYGRYLSFVPGEDSKSFHEGKSQRVPSKNDKVARIKKPLRSTSDTRNRSSSSQRLTSKSSSKNEYNYEDYWRPPGKSGRKNERKTHSGAELRNQRLTPQRYSGSFSVYNSNKKSRERGSRNNQNAHKHEENRHGKSDLQKFPAHVQKRIQAIRDEISRASFQDENGRSTSSRSRDAGEFDLLNKHRKHPKDHGKVEKDGYEKYVTKNGSEIWIRREESYSEIYHKSKK